MYLQPGSHTSPILFVVFCSLVCAGAYEPPRGAHKLLVCVQCGSEVEERQKQEKPGNTYHVINIKVKVGGKGEWRGKGIGVIHSQRRHCQALHC